MYEQTFLSLRYGYGAAIADRAVRADGELASASSCGGCCAAGDRMSMFPRPISHAQPRGPRGAYRVALLLSLALWLLPLAGVALTSLRSIDDLNRGNFWGWPSEIAFAQLRRGVRRYPHAAVHPQQRPHHACRRSPARWRCRAWPASRSPNTASAETSLLFVRLHRRQSGAVPDPDDPGAQSRLNVCTSTILAAR